MRVAATQTDLRINTSLVFSRSHSIHLFIRLGTVDVIVAVAVAVAVAVVVGVVVVAAVVVAGVVVVIVVVVRIILNPKP